MVGAQEVLNTRRTIYRFSEKRVDPSDLDSAFEAANNAPCHKQTYPWKYYVVGRQTREMMLPTVIHLSDEKEKRKGNPVTEHSRKRAVSKIMDVPIVVAVTTKRTPDDEFREEEDYAATVCSLHNLVLSLWDRGIGSQWSTGGITRHSATYECLGIPHMKERIIGFLKIGYPDSIPKAKERNTSDIVEYLP
tara:strand:+ start:527 stop:1099 length:573 start_codon:yes stop_codon:yes gene_type:complete